MRVHGQETEHIAEIHVGGIAERNNGGETDRLALRPIEHRGAQGARLRNQRHAAGRRTVVAEAGVESRRRAQNAETIWPDDAHVMETRVLEYFLFECRARIARFTETGRQNHRDAHARLAATANDVRHSVRGCGDYGQVHGLADVLDIRITGFSLHVFMSGIDRIQFAAESAREQIAKHQGADVVGLLAGAEDGDRVRRKQPVEIVQPHSQIVPGVPTWHSLK